MLKAMFGFGKEKRIKFERQVFYILQQELGIDMDPESNPWFGRYTGYVDFLSKYFYQKRSAEHCALALALIFWKGISVVGPHLNEPEGNELKLKLLSLINAYEQHGIVASNITAAARAELS